MAPKGMPLRQAGIIEVPGRVVDHADLLHDAAGTDVGGSGERDQRVQPQDLERMPRHGARPFGGEAAPPMVGGQPPADFNARSEMSLEAGRGETEKSDEGASFP